MTPDCDFILAAIAARLRRAHGERLKGVVLYGSEARGEARPDSDIDVLVLLDGPIRLWDDIQTNVGALYDLVLEWGRTISAKPVDAATYETGAWPLHRVARREGIVASRSCEFGPMGR